jgi:hypothetical protein
MYPSSFYHHGHYRISAILTWSALSLLMSLSLPHSCHYSSLYILLLLLGKVKVDPAGN